MRKMFFVNVLLSFLCFFFSVGLAQAQTTAFTYQGKLTDMSAPANGDYDFTFRLFDAASEGNQVGPVAVLDDVQVTNGIFTVSLDFGTSVFLDVATPRFLEISVRTGTSTGAYTTLLPRQQVTSSPFSIKTLNATSADALSSACNLCVTDAQIQTIDGSKVTGTVASATTAVNVSGIVPIANGGTGSSTKNFVDLSTDQTIGGNKTFSGNLNGKGSGLTNLNGSSITSGTISESRLGLAGMGFSGRINGLSSTNSSVFGGANGFTSATLTEGNITILSPFRTCTATNLYVVLVDTFGSPTSPGNSNVREIILRVDQTDSSIQCAITDFFTNCNSGSTAAISAGSRLSIRIFTFDGGSNGGVGGNSILFGWECR